MSVRHIILLFLGIVCINSQAQADKPLLKRQEQKQNLTKARLCPKLLTGDEVTEFIKGDSSVKDDQKNILMKDTVRLRSGITTEYGTKKTLESEQNSKGGDWALNKEEPLGAGSSLCTYVNSKIDTAVSSIKVSAYAK